MGRRGGLASVPAPRFPGDVPQAYLSLKSAAWEALPTETVTL